MLHRRTFIAAGAMATLPIGGAFAVPGDEMTIGQPGARLHLIEYASATCPHCAHFHETNWPRLKADYIDSGRIQFTMREMLTPPVPVALAMFQVARAGDAPAPEYFRRLEILFAQQRAILATGTGAGVRDALIALGGGWGLSEAAVMAALTDQRGIERINRALEEAAANGVNSTPAFFIGDQRINEPDFLTPDGMARTLDARLARL